MSCLGLSVLPCPACPHCATIQLDALQQWPAQHRALAAPCGHAQRRVPLGRAPQPGACGRHREWSMDLRWVFLSRPYPGEHDALFARSALTLSDQQPKHPCQVACMWVKVGASGQAAKILCTHASAPSGLAMCPCHVSHMGISCHQQHCASLHTQAQARPHMCRLAPPTRARLCAPSRQPPQTHTTGRGSSPAGLHSTRSRPSSATSGPARPAPRRRASAPCWLDTAAAAAPPEPIHIRSLHAARAASWA